MLNACIVVSRCRDLYQLRWNASSLPFSEGLIGTVENLNRLIYILERDFVFSHLVVNGTQIYQRLGLVVFEFLVKLLFNFKSHL
jgi:hypothetical protein